MTSGFQEILPNLYRRQSAITGPQQPVNSYLYTTPRGAVLIDPAVDLTPESLRQLGVENVCDIFITHTQAEHVDGAQHFPDARVHVPAGDEYLYDGAEAYRARDTTWLPPWDWETRGNFQGQLAGARNERPPTEPLAITSTLRDGETLCSFGVLATPGHGKNAITLLLEIAGQCVAFCGDLIIGDGRLWNWFDCDWDYGLEAGQHVHLSSVRRLETEKIDLLLPSHGDIVCEPQAALARLAGRIEVALTAPMLCENPPLNFEETASSARGWRELLPGLHQWRTGNCAALVSQTGNALLVDDGLCHWESLPERAAHHREAIADLKRALEIKKIEYVIPTHYHGDHIENIPELVAQHGTQVLSLDVLAAVLEQPEQFNLCCTLPWYGTSYARVPVHRRVPDGTRFQWHEYELEIFHLGGQTFYHAGVAVTVAGQQVLFVGDAIYGWSPQTEPVLTYNDNDPQTRGWLYSLERMLVRKPDLLVCGHGSAVRGPMPLLETKRNAWLERMEKFRQLSAREELRLFFDPYL